MSLRITLDGAQDKDLGESPLPPQELGLALLRFFVEEDRIVRAKCMNAKVVLPTYCQLNLVVSINHISYGAEGDLEVE